MICIDVVLATQFISSFGYKRLTAMKLGLFQAETPCYQFRFCGEIFQLIWRTGEFESVNDVVTGFQVVDESRHYFTVRDVLVGVRRAVQTSSKRLDLLLYVSPEKRPIRVLLALNHLCD